MTQAAMPGGMRVQLRLMPAINRATDAGLRQRFKWLHGQSVVVTVG